MKKQLPYILLAISFVVSISYLVLNIITSLNEVQALDTIINAGLISVLAILLIIVSFILIRVNETKYVNLIASTIILLVGFNTINSIGLFSLPTQSIVKDFTNATISDALIWARENNITVNQVFDTSDTIDNYHIINQSVSAGVLSKKIDTITFTVSSGPNYDKTIILPNMLTWQADDVLTFIKDNFLNNVEVSFVPSTELKNTVIEQNISGEVRRNAYLKLVFSIGSDTDIIPFILGNYQNMSLFEATFNLKMNGAKYELVYEFSDSVLKDHVISQSIKDKNLFDPKIDTLKLTISKGKKIVVPDILNMSVEDVTKWVVDNHLKIKFNDRYDDTIKAGKIIECNYKKGDEIIENTEITILTSKGPIKIGKFQNVQEFETWARKYDINYQINSQYDNNVPSGQIISMSVKENDIIKNNDAITVIISKGKSMTVPKLIGLTKDKALNECAKAGIICSTTTGGYNDTISKGSVMNQSISANTEVSEGTRVLLTLSSGPEIKVKVPNFYGLTWSSISSKCTNLGLNCNYVYSGYNSATKDTCISQSISFDNMVSSNTKLTMTLSKGPAKTANITLNASCFNMGSYNDAKSCLEQALSDYINDDYPFEMRAIANSEEGPGRKIAGCGIGISATITQGQTTTICIGK